MELELHQLDLKYERLRIADSGRQSRVVASLSEHGQQNPVLVVHAEEAEGRYVLIDGYRRVGALRQLGRDTIGAQVLEMQEMEALIFCHRRQRDGVQSALEEGWLIRELVELFSLSLGELGIRLGRSKSWVSRRLGLVRALPEPVQDLVRSGRLCAYGAMKYLVPLARANRQACVKLAAGIGDRKLSARQMEALYVAWRIADMEGRARIVENPLLFLSSLAALSEPAPEKKGNGKDEALFRDLEVLCAICHRLRGNLKATAWMLRHDVFRRRLQQGWRQSQEAFEALHKQWEEVFHAGPGYADGGASAQS